MNRKGYLHPLYPQSLIEFGEPVELPASEGWILKRPIPGTSLFDGMGCYPIFVCKRWSNLESDFDQIGGQLVSLSMVTDPFGNYTHEELLRYFKDIANPYKEHFVVDLQQNPKEFVAAHHQRNARKSMKSVKVEICPEPNQFLDEWCTLYDNLIERHNITGITKFSRESFAKQLNVPGIIAFRAIVDDITVGMLLWYKQGDIGYYHLGAYSSVGYQLNASFALFWTLIEHFADSGYKWLNLGAGAGLRSDGQDGLTRFKRGWSTSTRTAYFCGRIFDPQKYEEIMRTKNISTTKFFPAYRFGESND